MKWKQLFVLLMVFALLVGAFGHVPVARAATTYTSKPIGIYPGVNGSLLYLVRTGSYIDLACNNPMWTVSISGVTGVGVYTTAGTDLLNAFELNLSSGTFVSRGLFNNQYHTVSFSVWSNTGNHWTWSGSINFGSTFPTAYRTITASNPLAVSIAGPSVAAIGVPTSLGAVITGGIAPYEEQWTVFGDRNGGDYSGTRSAANVNFSHTYLATSAYNVRVKVWDSTGALAEGLWTMNGQSQKPVMHGQVLLSGSAGQMLDFGMYTDVNSNPTGAVSWAACVPTSDYVVTWPDTSITAEFWYQLLTSSTYPGSLVVTTRYRESNGQEWTYSFTFDTSTLTTSGSYVKSDGVSGNLDLEAGPPAWLAGTLNWLKQMFKDIAYWAFVPSADQMNELMPGGSLGTALLDQTSWGTGSGSWNLTVHAGSIAIPLVNISFDTINSWSFVGVIRTGIQAVMSVSLIYMIVVLI